MTRPASFRRLAILFAAALAMPLLLPAQAGAQMTTHYTHHSARRSDMAQFRVSTSSSTPAPPSKTSPPVRGSGAAHLTDESTCKPGSRICLTTQTCETLNAESDSRRLPSSRLSVDDLLVGQRNRGGRFRSVPARLLPPSPVALTRQLSFRSCAVVGNSGTLLLTAYGKEIDSHSVVFRLNAARTRGYEAHVGTKTHFRLLNGLWTSKYPPLAHQAELLSASAPGQGSSRVPLERTVTLIASRGAKLEESYVKLAGYMRANRVDVGTTLLHPSALSRTRQALDVFRGCAAMGGRRFRGGRAPSSGMVLVFNLKDLCGRTSVYGFGTERVGGRVPRYQYYTQRQGNPTHSFSAEMELLRALANSSLIRLCSGGECIGRGSRR